MTYQIDPRQLVRWLGTEGARAGLTNSKRLTIDVLREIARSLDIKLSEKANRQQWVDEIVKIASRRIDKPIDQLFDMEEQEILNYFEHIEVESPEILDLLRELDLSPRREGRRSLLEFAAKELSETGRFMRIAGKQRGKSDTQDIRPNGGKRDAAKRNTSHQAEPITEADQPHK